MVQHGYLAVCWQSSQRQVQRLGGEGLPGWEEHIQVRSQQGGLQILIKALAGMVCPKHCFRKTSLGLVVRIIGVTEE